MKTNYLDVRPRLIERSRGGWLAVSEEDSHLRIGVEGQTEKEAVANFTKALHEWERLRALPDPDRTRDEAR